MLTFAIYLTFLFINFVLLQLDPMPGHHEREIHEIKAKSMIGLYERSQKKSCSNFYI